MTKHSLDPEERDEEESTLRPSFFKDFIGQRDSLANLSVYIQAAKQRGEALDHVLLSGPPGLGKTTIAGMIANELGVSFESTTAPAISKGADLAKILTGLSENSILFIDEIHSLNKRLEEILYPAMESFRIDLIVGEGMTAQSVQIPLKPFTLIGATTRSGLVSQPLRSRFGIQLRLEYYEDEEMAEIIHRSAGILNTEVETDAALEIGRRSRKTPRTANILLKRIRDFAEVHGQKKIGLDLTKEAFRKMGIDELGLDGVDRKILECIIVRYKGGPVGLRAIAAVVGEEERTVEDTYESFMVRAGLINRTPAGRVATEKAYRQLNLQYENSSQDTSLF